MIDIHRMISRLVQLMQYPYLTPSLGSSSEDCITEVFLGYHLRTTEGKEYATRLYLLQCLHVQAGIALQGMRQSTSVLSEGRRVEDNQIILIACLFKVFESILAKCLMTRVTRKVEFHVTVR